ncbi:MAG: hypothetical protein Q9164_004191 [Protoblastenia rupestris]
MVNKKLREKRQREQLTDPTPTTPLEPSTITADNKGIHQPGTRTSSHHFKNPTTRFSPPPPIPTRKYYTAKQLATHYNLFSEQLRTFNTDPLNGRCLVSLASQPQQAIQPDLRLVFILLDECAHPEWPFLILSSEEKKEWSTTCLLPVARHPLQTDAIPVFVLVNLDRGSSESRGSEDTITDEEVASRDYCYYAGTFRITHVRYLSGPPLRNRGYCRTVKGDVRVGSGVPYWDRWREMLIPSASDGRAFVGFEEVKEGEGVGDPLNRGEEEVGKRLREKEKLMERMKRVPVEPEVGTGACSWSSTPMMTTMTNGMSKAASPKTPSSAGIRHSIRRMYDKTYDEWGGGIAKGLGTKMLMSALEDVSIGDGGLV